MTSSDTTARARLGELAGLPADDRLIRLSDWGPAEDVLLPLISEAARLAMFDTGEASTVTRLLLDLAVQTGADLAAAQAEANLADVAAREGRLRDCVAHTTRARSRFERAGTPERAARQLAAQADAKARLGHARSALDDYEQALPLLEQHRLLVEAARARIGMGHALLRLGRMTDAETALAAAATELEELGQVTGRARVDVTRAELCMAHGRADRARMLALRALLTIDDHGADAIRARHLLARIAMAAGDLALAEAEITDAIGAAQTLDLAPALADLWHTRGRIHRMRREGSEAVAALSEAAEQADRVRGSLAAEAHRAAHLGNRATLHEELVECVLGTAHEGDLVARMFSAIERGKNSALLDQIGSALEPAGTDRRSEVRYRLNALYSGLDEVHAESARAWRDRVHEHERQRRALEMPTPTDLGVEGLLATPVDVEDLQHTLPSSTVVIEYFTTGSEVIACLIERHRALVCRVAGVADVETALDRIASGGTEPLRDLYGALVEPFAERIANRHLVVVPHGILHRVPFAALHDGDRYLIETNEIRSAPSSSIAAALASRPRTNAASGCLVVSTDTEGEKETAAALGTVDVVAQRLHGDAASVEHVLREAPDVDILHFSCHGGFEHEHPERSGLRLADRWMTPNEIMDLELHARVVTLDGTVDGANALAGVFLAAGAGAVLIHAWPGEHTGAPELTRAFYGAWGAGEHASPAAALRAAQLTLIRDGHPTAQWARLAVLGGIR